MNAHTNDRDYRIKIQVSEQSDWWAIRLVGKLNLLRNEHKSHIRRSLISAIKDELSAIDNIRAAVGWPPFTYLADALAAEQTGFA